MSKIESFEIDIAELKRTRTVWVYLPDDYKPTGKPSPVIYMHDGQNLFYDKLAAYGKSWRADKTMDEIFAQTGHSAIIVGVDSNEKHRLSEYSPWKKSGIVARRHLPKDNRGGEGKQYAEFFAKSLKHTVDSRYNTDKSREATAIIGSSMGGLISCYIALSYQRIYETMGLFSTWSVFSQKQFDGFVKKTPQILPQRALVYCGGKENENEKYAKVIADASLKLYKNLQKRGVSCELLMNSDFVHDETAWGVYFFKFASDFLARYYSSVK